MNWLTPDPARLASRHVQIFVPSVDRDGQLVPHGQEFWVRETVETLARLFGGATAFPVALGAWRDDERDGAILTEDVVVVFSYVAEDDLAAAQQPLYDFVMRLGRETQQGEVGLYVDGSYYGFRDFGSDDHPGGVGDAG